MKFSELNVREKKAYKNIKYACDDLIGGLVNTMQDFDKDSKEFKSAQKMLCNHDDLVDELYYMATTNVYDVGMCAFGESAKRYIKDIRFCGKEWLMEMCDKRIKKEGY